MFDFKIIKEDKKSKVRLGIVKTAHGSFETPAFIPVATAATLRALDNRDIKELGASGHIGSSGDSRSGDIQYHTLDYI